METIPPLNGGIRTHIYYERYVNEGTREYSKVSEINEFDEVYRPTSDSVSIRVARFLVPRSMVEVYDACPSDNMVKNTEKDDYIIMFVHPQCLEMEIPFMDYLKQCQRLTDLPATPTSSTRTVICRDLTEEISGCDSWAVKLSCPKRISKYDRNISTRMVRHSVAMTKMLDAVNLSSFGFLRESRGIGFKTADGELKPWGFLCRDYIPQPPSPISGTTLIPCFALYGGYKYSPSHPKLFGELLHRERIISGRDISATEFALHNILYVIINSWIHIFREHGVIIDAHGQNLLMELSPEGKILRFIYRDMDVPFYLSIREKKGLVSDGYHPDVVAERITPHRPFGSYVSLSYDRFMGECFFDFIDRLLIEEYKVAPQLLSYHCKVFFEAKFPNFREYFPRTVHVYSSEEISRNFFAIIPTSRIPKWRPEIESPLVFIDTTFREGLQSKLCDLTPSQMITIMKKLDKFGAQYMELPNPRISEEMVDEISSLILYRNQHQLRIKLLLHVRLMEEDINAAIACKGIDGLNITIGTSKTLATNSHRLTVDDICKRAKHLLQSIDRKNLIIRFSGEDSFRSDEKDLYYLLGELTPYIDRFGIPDTLGIATSSQIKDLMKGCKLKTTEIAYECHFHNDSGCATANAFESWLSGARYINTTILGIGERNGITGMADFIARMYTYDKNTLKGFNLMKLVSIYKLAVNIFGFPIPPNTPIVGDVCFYHKAGIHTKAMLNNNNTYQAIDPNDFGLKTQIAKFSSLTGWNTVKQALLEIGIDLPDEKVKLLTKTIKTMK